MAAVTFTNGLSHVLVAYTSDDGNNYQISTRQCYMDKINAPSGIDPGDLPEAPQGVKPRVGHFFATATVGGVTKKYRRQIPILTLEGIAAIADGSFADITVDGRTWKALGWTGERSRSVDVP